MLDKNTEITNLAREIMGDITNNNLPLHNILLKASNLSLLLTMPKNVSLFKEWSKYAEQNEFIISTFQVSMTAAQDPNISLASSNPSQYVFHGYGNSLERGSLRSGAQSVTSTLAHYRAETFNFVQGVYTKWVFENTVQTLFERKRSRTATTLIELLPDTQQILNSISNNLISQNPEDLKNAVVSCRTLFVDIADKLNPAIDSEDKPRYINRLKDYVSPKDIGHTKMKLIKTYLDEIKNRIEFTIDLTQGKAHQDRPIKDEAEDIVLYTYLIISDLLEIYNQKNQNTTNSNKTIEVRDSSQQAI